MKPNFRCIISTFKKEGGVARTKITQAAAGNYTDPNASRRKRIQERTEKLAGAVAAYERMELDNWLALMISYYDA